MSTIEKDADRYRVPREWDGWFRLYMASIVVCLGGYKPCSGCYRCEGKGRASPPEAKR